MKTWLNSYPMILRRLRNVMYLITSLLFSSCGDEFIEKDLSKETVVVLAPQDGIKLGVAKVNFVWSEVKGALKYHLQVVKPSYSSIQNIALDTMVTKTSFSFILNSGSYEWRIRPVNGSSNGIYTYKTFSIDSGLDISKKKVVLNTPKNDSISNKLTQRFGWFPLANAQRYLFEISLDGNVIASKTLEESTVDYSFPSSGTYQWKVLGLNETTPSAYSDPFTITIDNKAPSAPEIVTFTNDTTSSPVKLTWTSDVSAIGDSVYIASDNQFKTLLTRTFSKTASYTFSTGTTGTTYYWRVRSKDAATNMSEYSAAGKFKVN